MFIYDHGIDIDGGFLVLVTLTLTKTYSLWPYSTLRLTLSLNQAEL